ncbi:rRNA maturation RNase YbeY [Gangjinia marincola]|uniref:Endoribonuclease YbeY n=1 Tax=Gangjinia marincola TaxID=578463 RepID=A0ABN1MHS5_9FLAO
MISFFNEVEGQMQFLDTWKEWIRKAVKTEDKVLGELNIILCDDNYLLGLNQKFLNHDTLTDIITFDNTLGRTISGEIYISYDRVKYNADKYGVSHKEELQRVVIHGVLHLCGYNDKTEDQKAEMRKKENDKLEMFHVEQ